MIKLYKKQEDLFNYKKCCIEKKNILTFYFYYGINKIQNLLKKSALIVINALFFVIKNDEF